MPSKKSTEKADPQIQLTKEVQELSKELRKLKSLDFLQVFSRPWRFMFFSFMKGVMVGFGSVLGASVVVALFLYLLAQISFVPYIGDFVEQVISQINIEQQSPAATSN